MSTATLNSKLVLGSAQFGMNYGVAGGTKVAGPEVREILNLSRSFGVKLIDTAQNYGVAEKALGEHSLEGFEVITKLSPQFSERSRLSEKDVILGQFIDDQYEK